jgi:diadenosine tetraphosphate (Ap4A) HIT family hydrolase
MVANEAASCPICSRGVPLDVLVELGGAWVTAPREAALPGYVCIVSKIHVTEPHELIGAARAAWWDDVATASAAVQRATGSPKLNYEIHGNTIPHLHVHVFPRYPGDPFEGRPIDPRHRLAFRRSSADLERLQLAILETRAEAHGER